MMFNIIKNPLTLIMLNDLPYIGQSFGIPYGRFRLSSIQLPVLAPSSPRPTTKLLTSRDNDLEDDLSFFQPSVSTEDLLGGYGAGENGKRKLIDKMASLYSDDQMARLLSVHNNIESEISQLEETTTTSVFTSLHDIIVHNIEQVNLEQSIVDPILLAKAKNVVAIASDVDGTLLSTKDQIMHPRTRTAIIRAIQNPNLHFFPATGKSRRGALDSLGPEIEMLFMEHKVAGIFLQGLYCVDGNGDVLLERKLSLDAVEQIESLANEAGIAVVGYDGDDLYSTEMNDIVVHLSQHYGEPMPRLLKDRFGEQLSLYQYTPSMHKLLLMENDVAKLALIRPKLENVALQFNAKVTQALPTMLELIPAGCSKAQGVEAVCRVLGIDPRTQLLSMGDAENDLEMLELAAVGVAMGNACPRAREAANHVMHLQCDEGGAGCALELFGF